MDSKKYQFVGTKKFTPKDLFKNGEQGVWYDPSDISRYMSNQSTCTMYQDSTGVTPVTGVEQPVGLMLDKSKNLLLGNELIPNGDFSTTTNWSTPAGWVISGGVCTATTTVASLKYSPVCTAGRFYIVEFDWTHTAGTLYVRVGTGPAITFTTSGKKRVILMANDTNGFEAYGGAVSGMLDNVSVRELKGNHAYQTTAIDRPILRNRYNLFTESEFRNGIVDAPVRWGLVSESTLGGYSKAIAFGYDGATISYAYKTPLTGVIGTTYTLSVVVSMTNGLSPVFGSSTTSDILNDFCIVIAGNPVTPTLYRINNLGNNNYSVTATHTTTIASANFGIVKYVTNSSRTFKVTAYHLEIGTEIKYYQKIDTETVYDSNFSKFPVYLACNGTNTGMRTNNLDLSATDEVNVFAGVRKLSDSAVGMIVELGNGTTTSRFHLTAPSGFSTPTFNFISQGTLVQSAGININNYPAPISAVLTGIGDISGDLDRLRVNGQMIEENLGDQGTGNYSNLPLYLFRRAGTSLPFNGNLYGLIIRGKLSTDKQIRDCEKYLTKKLG